MGYDLAAFFERNRDTLKATVDGVLKALLSPETPPESALAGGADELDDAEETEE